MKKIVNYIFLLICIFNCSLCFCADKNEDFNEYWYKFRLAVINNDMDAIVRMTKFPFNVYGKLDFLPKLKYNKKQFVENFDKILLNKSSILTGVDTVYKPMIELIEEFEEIHSEEYFPDGYMHVGSFIFIREKGKWLFTIAGADTIRLIRDQRNMEKRP